MAEHNRRSFLTWATHGLGVLFAAIIGVPAVAYLIDGRNRKAGAKDFRPVDGIKLTEFRAMPKDYAQQGTLYAIRRDAWTLHPNDVIGRIWAVKSGPGENDIKVYTTICPHLGCSINLNAQRPDGTSNGFTCPCHGGKFGMDGSLQGPPAPRGMDELRWKADDANPNVMLVEYKNFKQGEHDRVEKT